VKTPHVVILAAVVSVISSVLTVKVLSMRTSELVPSAVPATLADDLETIRREQEKFRASTAAPSVTAAEVEAIVSRAMEELVKRGEASQPDPGAITAALQRLLDTSLTDADRSAIWEQLAKAGMLDALVTEFERRALAAPQDSTAQTDLGFAYHQKMRFSGGGPEAGKWGKMGSDAYAKAIELDATNWPARFAQAQHFYDAGMQGDALVHLNVLREQQKTRRAEERHAAAFILLGNLYLEQGNAAEAKKVWQEGMSLFPSNERLRELFLTLD
jgi:tetratricopeptide (TPR) repeat protein